MFDGNHMNGHEGLISPVRNRYFYGKLLDVRHLEMEQRYMNEKRWLVNRLGLGAGVLCGLEVEPAGEEGLIVVRPGIAIDPLGREIVVDRPVKVDARQLTDECGRPEGDPLDTGFVQVLLCYHECPTEPAPVMVADCDVHEECEASAVRERFRVTVHEVDTDDIHLPGLPAGACALFARARSGRAPTGDVSVGRRPPLRWGASGTAHPLREFVADVAGPAGAREIPSGILGRRMLCAILEHACGPPEELCVPIAFVRLGGEHSGIEACATRTNIYSNATLLDLILCLADQLRSTTVIEDGGGDAQTGKVSAFLPKAVVIRAASETGEPLNGVPVRFRVRGGGGQVAAVTEDEGEPQGDAEVVVPADDEGKAGVRWRLGPEAGLNTVEASVVGEVARITFHALAQEEQG
jgi:hypothetical protein